MTDLLSEWIHTHGGEIAVHDGKVTGYDERAKLRFTGVVYDPGGTVKDLDAAIKATVDGVDTNNRH